MPDAIRFPRPPFSGPTIVRPTVPTVPTVPTTPSTPTIIVPPKPPDIFDPLRPLRPLPRGFVVPRMELYVPDNLGRPPTSNDVQVRKGFDLKTPDQVVSDVVANLQNPLDPSNRRFVEETIRSTHKALTIGVNNAFTPNTPHRQFLEPLSRQGRITVLGTMSTMQPVVYQLERPNLPPQHYVFANGRFEQLPQPPRAPVVIRTELHFRMDGVRMQYPHWQAPVLSGPTATIIEG